MPQLTCMRCGLTRALNTTALMPQNLCNEDVNSVNTTGWDKNKTQLG